MKTEDVSPYGEAVKLAEKHGGVWGYDQSKLYIFDQPQLAALIAEVRREAMRECAETEIYVDPSDMTNLQRRWHSAGEEALRGAIRVRMEEGK